MSHAQDELAALWRSQPAPTPEVDLDAIDKRARRHGRQVRTRNAIEWLAAAVVIVLFGAQVADPSTPPISRIASAWIALAAVYIAYRLYREGRWRELPDPGQDSQRYLLAYRDALLRQARLLQRAPVWYVAPIAAGALAHAAGHALAAAEAGPTAWAPLVPIAVVCGVIAWINVRGARRLRDQAERLPTVAGDAEEAS